MKRSQVVAFMKNDVLLTILVVTFFSIFHFLCQAYKHRRPLTQAHVKGAAPHDRFLREGKREGLSLRDCGSTVWLAVSAMGFFPVLGFSNNQESQTCPAAHRLHLTPPFHTPFEGKNLHNPLSRSLDGAVHAETWSISEAGWPDSGGICC
eukprot:scaffold276892_cov18-Tisochrysis_lutea.AAC.2